MLFFFFKQKTAYEMRISDWSSDVCSSDLALDDVFTPEAIIDYTEMVGIKGNLKEIKAFLAESMKQISNSQHIISTTQLTVEGDRAQGRTICTNPMEIASNGHMMFVGLWYRDEFVRTPKGWRISSRNEDNSWRYKIGRAWWRERGCKSG